MHSVLAAARELLQQRHFDEVIDCCRTALDVHPRHIELRLLHAEALMLLRRDGEAQSEVALALREQPSCPQAYRLLGELAFRRDELRAAETFLREALRVSPTDHSSASLLEMVQRRKTPAAAAAKLPAASAAAGSSPASVSSGARLRARGTEPEPMRVFYDTPAPELSSALLAAQLADKTAVELTGSVEIDLAAFEASPDFEGVTSTDQRLDTSGEDFDDKTSNGGGLFDLEGPPTMSDDSMADDGATREQPRPDLPPIVAARSGKRPWVRPDTNRGEVTTCDGTPEVQLGAPAVGFGEYLVMTGALTRWQLYRVLQVQDWKHVRVGEAAVTLGFISAPRLELLLSSYLADLSAGHTVVERQRNAI
jgi:hypothetical protein